MGIFSDAQGQLTTRSKVVSGQNSNSFKLLWLSLLSARMETFQSKKKAQEWSKHYIHQFLSCSMATNSVVGILAFYCCHYYLQE